jgi:hypothetical protein
MLSETGMFCGIASMETLPHHSLDCSTGLASNAR